MRSLAVLLTLLYSPGVTMPKSEVLEAKPLTQLPSLPTRLDYLDCLRALAALYVVVYHIVKYIDFPDPSPNVFVRLVKYAASGFYHGDYAVALFIVLSGFCLMLPVIRGNYTIRGGLFKFFKRRAQRILPPYYFATAFSLILIGLFIGQATGTHWDKSTPVTLQSILAHLLLIQDLTGDAQSINHTFWSIAVEWRMYFLFPVLVWGWRRFGAFQTSVTAVIISGLLFWFCFQWLGNGFHADYIGLFTLGGLGATVAFSNLYPFEQVRKLPWSSITLATTVSIAVLSRTKLWHPLMPTFIDYVVGIWAMSLMILGAQVRSAWFHRLLNYKPLVAIGLFSYSIYLIHGPVLQVVWQYWLPSFHTQPVALLMMMVIIGLPVVVAVSYLFFLLCERPFLQKS
jgi:peptidoglycan/LPS O-acetylase OafA/YrhL